MNVEWGKESSTLEWLAVWQLLLIIFSIFFPDVYAFWGLVVKITC